MRVLTNGEETPTTRAYALGDGEGQAIWFLGSLMVVKADGQNTEGRFDLLESTMPSGYGPPRHKHDADEAWYVLEGDVTFYAGDAVVAADRGSWVFAPRNVEHTFKVGPHGARFLAFAFPAGFGEFVKEFGAPASTRAIPPAGPVDAERLAAIARKYGIEITGGPPK